MSFSGVTHFWAARTGRSVTRNTFMAPEIDFGLPGMHLWRPEMFVSPSEIHSLPPDVFPTAINPSHLHPSEIGRRGGGGSRKVIKNLKNSNEAQRGARKYHEILKGVPWVFITLSKG